VRRTARVAVGALAAVSTLATSACSGSVGGERARAGDPTTATGAIAVGAEATRTSAVELRAGFTYLLTEHVYLAAAAGSATLASAGELTSPAARASLAALDANAVALSTLIGALYPKGRAPFLVSWRQRDSVLVDYAQALRPTTPAGLSGPGGRWTASGRPSVTWWAPWRPGWLRPPWRTSSPPNSPLHSVSPTRSEPAAPPSSPSCAAPPHGCRRRRRSWPAACPTTAGSVTPTPRRATCAPVSPPCSSPMRTPSRCRWWPPKPVRPGAGGGAAARRTAAAAAEDEVARALAQAVGAGYPSLPAPFLSSWRAQTGDLVGYAVAGSRHDLHGQALARGHLDRDRNALGALVHSVVPGLPAATLSDELRPQVAALLVALDDAQEASPDAASALHAAAAHTPVTAEVLAGGAAEDHKLH